MYTEARKINLIEAVLKVGNEATLVEFSPWGGVPFLSQAHTNHS